MEYRARPIYQHDRCGYMRADDDGDLDDKDVSNDIMS